jgi:hypothetical protein
MEGARNVGRRLVEQQWIPQTWATSVSQPDSEQINGCEHAGTRRIVSATSLLIDADDLVAQVQSRYKLKDEIHVLYQ